MVHLSRVHLSTVAAFLFLPQSSRGKLHTALGLPTLPSRPPCNQRHYIASPCIYPCSIESASQLHRSFPSASTERVATCRPGMGHLPPSQQTAGRNCPTTELKKCDRPAPLGAGSPECHRGDWRAGGGEGRGDLGGGVTPLQRQPTPSLAPSPPSQQTVRWFNPQRSEHHPPSTH